jgi:hypothetical protein
MAKSKPIGVRFDLDKLEMIQKEQNLTSVQQVVNYLMDNYGEKEEKTSKTIKNTPPYQISASKLADINEKVKVVLNKSAAENEPKEGSLAWFIKNS